MPKVIGKGDHNVVGKYLFDTISGLGSGSNRHALYEGGSISVSSGVTTNVSFSSSNRKFDDDGRINTSNNRFVAPSDGNLALVVFNFVTTPGGTIGGTVQRNGFGYGGSSRRPEAWGDQGADPDNNGFRGKIAFATEITSGDYFLFRLYANQNKSFSFSVYVEILR